MDSLILIRIFVFIFGLCIGSFLNCVIYRLDENKKLSGRSFCPECQHQLKWQDLIPVFSFVFLRGKCRYCKEKISWQYPIVEISTAIVFTLILLNFGFIWSLEFGIWNFIKLCFMFYIASVFIVIFVYDLKHYIIPDKILFPAMVIAFIYRLGFWIWDLFGNWKLEIGNSSAILNYLLAVVISSGFFLIIFLISGGRWIGFGDVKLAILMGLLLGFPNILIALFFAFVSGAVVGVALMVLQKKGLKSEIPFGPFLIIGTFIALFWGQQVMDWYLNNFLFI